MTRTEKNKIKLRYRQSVLIGYISFILLILSFIFMLSSKNEDIRIFSAFSFFISLMISLISISFVNSNLFKLMDYKTSLHKIREKHKLSLI